MKNTLYRLLLLPWLLLAAWEAHAQAPAWVGATGITAGTAANAVVQAVATNAAGDVFVAGTFAGSASFGTTNGTITLTSSGGDDMYVAKWNSAAGNWAWAVSGGGSTDADGAYGIAVNGTNVYVTGSYNGSANISGSTLSAVGAADMFVAKYIDNTTGAGNGGAVSGGSGGSDRGTCIAVNGTNVYVGGYYTGTTANSISGSSLPTAGNNNVFLAKYTDNGTLQNGGALGSATSATERATSIAVNGSVIYLGGYFNGASLTFGSTTLTGQGGQDLFIARYTDSGSLAATGAISSGGGGGERVTGLAVNGTTVYATGYFDSSSITIAGTALSANGGSTTPTGANDIFVAKYTDASGALQGNGAVSNSGSSADDEALGIAASGSTIYVTGLYNGNTTIAGTALTAQTGGNEIFVAKYNDAGGLQGQGALSAGTNASGATDFGTAITATSTQAIAVGVKDPGSVATFGSFTVPSGPTGFLARVGQSSTTVTSITTNTTSPTNASSITYTVTFATSVSGLTASNFSLSPNGTGGSIGTVAVVSGSNNTQYTVTVNTGSGNGTLQLNLANDNNLTPGLSNDPYAGPSITIDKTAPTVAITSTAGASGAITNTTPIPFTVTFSENVTGFGAGDVTVGNGSVVSGSFSGSGTTYTFTVTPTTAGTATTVNVAANVAQDAATNGNAAATQFSITYQLPTVTVAAVTGTTPSPTATATVNYAVTFSGSVSGLTTSNFNLTTSGISGASVTSVSNAGSNTYTVVVNTGTGDGTLRLNVNNSTGVTPTISNVPYTSGTTYTITKSFTAAPTLRIQAAGSASNNGDVTAFVDVVQVLQSGTSTAVANALQNASFETNNVDPSSFRKASDAVAVVASPWSFTSTAGVSRNNSAFGSTAADGDAVALVQSTGNNDASISQNLAVPTGTYQVRFQTMQRNYTSKDQRLNVFLVQGGNIVFIGNIQPNNNTPPTYDTFTSASFSVTAPALTAAVSTTSASPTSTAPIPFSVTFSQSVGTTFTASDVTVAGGLVTSGSFSGSGAGPYTFTVNPSGTGTVTVSLAASVANDANNTPNTASNSVSVQFQAPTIVVAPNSLPQGTQNVAYSQTLSASGGTAPYTYAITAGALPNGLSLSSSGTIAGTPAANSTFTFTVTATDASAAPGPYTGSKAYTLVINTQPATAAPVVTTPANGSFSNNRSVTVTGTAPAGSTVSIYIGNNLTGTTTALATGAFSFVIPGNAPDGTFVVSATAQSSGATVSPSSNGNAFTIDGTAPTVTLSSATVASGGTTSTSPVSFTATFNELVTSLTAAGLTVTNGTVTSGPTAGSGNTYTFQVTPSAAGTVTVQVAAGAAQDRATNGNTASALYSFTFAAPSIAISPTSLPNGQQGVAYSQALSASGGTAPYSYAITAGALPSGLSLNTSGTIAGTPTTNGTFNFTVTVTDASTAPGPYSGSQSYSLVITAPAITATIWTGTISTDWFTAGNWTQGVPTATVDATIPTAPSGGRFPALSAGTANVRNLTFNSGATLNQSGGTLAIAGNLTNNGTFLPTGGTVVLGNTTLSSVLGSSNSRFWNLTVGASGTQLSTPIGASVQRLLTLNGNFSTNGNSFVLESNNTLTALVVNNGSSVVNGTVTVQRAIDPSVNPGLGYRHYSSPVSNSIVGDLATSGFTPVVNPTYNTSATPDAEKPFPTVYGYDDSRLSLTNSLNSFDKGYFSPSALSDPLAVGKGYTVNIAASELVDFQGTLNNGDLSLNLTSTRNTYPADGGWQFLGNPYPAPLDYSRVAPADRVGLEGAIYIYSSTSQYQGRYRVYINGIGNPVVPMGQGFFTRAASGQTTATMTFRNSYRLTTPNGTTLQRTTADPRPLVQLTLQGQGAAPADEAYVYFENGATSGFEPAFDAEKLPNPTGFNLSTTQAGKQLSINGQPELGTTQRVVPLAVGVPAAGSYTFTAAQLLNLSQVPVYLRDKQTGALIDLAQQPSYSFSVGSAATLVQGRFELVFSPQQVLAATPAALAEQVGLYPNPATSQVAIELPATLGRQAVTVSLVDAVGRTVRTQVLRAGLASHTLPLNELATGVYSLRFHTEAGVLVKKLVIE